MDPRSELKLSRGTYRVTRLIGEGGQGRVFEVSRVGRASDPLALKWYFPHAATRTQRAMIEYLVERGAPDENFLWPLEVVDDPSQRGFGYVMPLRPPEFVGLADLVTSKVDVPFSTVSTLAVELTSSFLSLHAEGLSYRDISFGNVFFNPASGVPLICDNDNVGVDGAGPSAILGTRLFMAPEIVRGEASPSADTDRFSLSILLFYLLAFGHPLLGRRELEFPCWDETAEMQMLGWSPLFVFDPDDDSNRPDPELHSSVVENWRLMPEQIRTLFVQAFTGGLHDPRNGRVRESVWRAALTRLRDSILNCPHCGKENFLSDEDDQRSCWQCHRHTGTPLQLKFNDMSVVLNQRTRLFQHHVKRDYDFSVCVAEVRQHPESHKWGLQNTGRRQWVVTLPDGRTIKVTPGGAIGLMPDAEIDFGGTRARIST